MKTIVPLVYDKQGKFIDGAICFTQTTDLDGAFCTNGNELIVPDSLRNTQFTVAAKGYQGYSESIDLGEGDKQIRVGLAPDLHRPQDIILPGLDTCQIFVPKPIEQILVQGKGFITVSDKDWQQLNITAFRLFRNYLDGLDIKPFLSWAAKHGNTLRVFFTCEQEFILHPENYTAKEVIEFFDLLAEFGLYCEAVAFADYQLVFKNDLSAAVSYFNELCDTLRQTSNKFLELVNENDVSVNTLPTNEFTRPSDIISSHGSGGGDVDPITPAWDYMTFHPGRSNEWPRKPKSAREFQDANSVPCTNNETNRPDLAGYVLSDFSDAGFVSGILASGVNAHSLSLKQAIVPIGDELACIEMILNSASLVPTYAQHGMYVRGNVNSDGPCPMFHSDSMALRTFATLFDNEAHCIIVRPTPDNPRKAVNGWTIESNVRNYYHLVK